MICACRYPANTYTHTHIPFNGIVCVLHLHTVRAYMGYTGQMTLLCLFWWHSLLGHWKESNDTAIRRRKKAMEKVNQTQKRKRDGTKVRGMWTKREVQTNVHKDIINYFKLIVGNERREQASIAHICTVMELEMLLLLQKKNSDEHIYGKKHVVRESRRTDK